MKRIFILLFALIALCPAISMAQLLYSEDFESGDLNDWILDAGYASVSPSNPLNGIYSLKIWQNTGSYAWIKNPNVSCSFGIYEAWFFISGLNTDAFMQFQHQSSNTYYQVSLQPNGTDNPKITLYKWINGNYTILAVVTPPNFSTDEWVKLTIHRMCNGDIKVYVNDQLKISENDSDIFENGYIRLGSWESTIYVDDISINNLNTFYFTETAMICAGETYTWQGGNYTEAGTYYANYTTTQSCDSIYELILTVNPVYNLSEDIQICTGDSLYVAGGWQTASGSYSESFTSSLGCDSLVTVNLMVTDGIIVTNIVEVCEGDSVFIHGSWQTTGGLFYDTLTAISGCDSIVHTELTFNPNFSIQSETQICDGDTYSFGSQFLTTSSIYTETFISTTGCDSTVTLTLIVNPLAAVNITVADVSCFGADDGSAITNVTGGTQPYSYFWSTGEYLNSINNLAPGNYSVTVNDSLGCITTTTFSINEPPELTIIMLPTDISCDSVNNGTITVVTYGGMPPYSYLWSNGETTDSISSLQAGMYFVTVIDSAMCYKSDSTSISQIIAATIRGTVTWSGGTFQQNDATIILYHATTETGMGHQKVAETQIDSLSEFTFSCLMPDTYYIKVVVNSNEYPGVKNTYYDSVHAWSLATPIIITGDTTVELTVHMYEFNNPGNGNGNITGNIYYTNKKNLKATGDPVPGAEVFIEQEPLQQPIANTCTDSIGFYAFDNIPAGNGYQMYVDIPGIPHLTTYNFYISDTDTVYENFNFIVDTSETEGGIFSFSGTGIKDTKFPEITVHIYPNPTREFFSIEYKLNEPAHVNIAIFGSDGLFIKELMNSHQSSGDYKYTFNTHDLGFAQCAYFVKFSIGKNTIIKKIVGIK